MKQIRLSIVIVTIALLTASASASLRVNSKIMIDARLPGGLGGQFGVLDPANSWGYGFDYFVTFCAEVNQTIANRGMYFVTGMSGQNTTGKLLGEQSKYLYAQFRKGSLGPGFSYTSGEDANGLQYGIWQGMGYSHDEIQAAIGVGTADRYLASWAAKSVQWMSALNSFVDPGVRVMQLGDTMGGTGNRQDQLVIMPEPMSVMTWGGLALAIAGFGLARRAVN